MALAALACALAFTGSPALRPVTLAAGLLAVGVGAWAHRRLRRTEAPPFPDGRLSYQAFVDQLPDALVLCDAAGTHVLYANQAALDLCGASGPTQVIGQPLTAFMRPEEYEAEAVHLYEFMASGHTVGQPRRLRLLGFDGAERTAETVASRVTLQSGLHVALTLWDVTTRERTEAHTAYLASFPELTPIPTLEVRPDGQLVYANPAARAAFPGLDTPDHPLLKRLPAFRRALARGASSIVPRLRIGPHTFEVHLYSVSGSENVRIYAQDVTVQQEALRSLSESREKFSRVFLGSPVPLVVVRVRDGVFVDLNDAFVRLVGAETRDSVLGLTPMDAGFWNSPQERREHLLLFRDLPIEGRLASFRRLDTGEQRRVEFWADRIEVGGEACWAGVFLDVEAHLSAEEALQGERDFVQSLLDALGEGVVLADAQDRFAYVNPAFERLIGAPAVTLAGQPIVDHVDPSDRVRYHDETGRRQAGESSSYELCFLHADGTPRPVLVTGVPIRAGRYAGGVAAVVTDLSALKAAQAEVERQKEYYEEILNRLPLQLSTFDADGRYQYVNPAALPNPERRAWIIGRTSPEFRAHHGLDSEIMDERYRHEQDAIRHRRTEQWMETLPVAGGAQHYARVVTPVLDAQGRFRFAIAYAVDITERVETERQVRMLKEFYESVLAYLPLRVMVFDSEGRLAFANAEVVSDEAARARLIGQPIVSAMQAAGLSAEAAGRLLDHVRAARLTGSVQTWEEQAEAEGETRSLLFAVRPLDDPSASYVGYAIDVTEQRQADARTEAVKQFYERVLENIPVEVAVLDAEARVRYLNPASVRDPEMRAWLVGRNTVDYARARGFDPAPFERREAWLQEILASRAPASLEEHLDLPGRPPRTIVRHFTPILRDDGEVDHLIGYSIDLTERVEAERRVEELKTFYEGVLDALPIEVAVLDPEGRVRYANPAGVHDPAARQALIGKTTVEYARWKGYDPALFERREAWVRSVIASRVPSQYEERFDLPGRPVRTILRSLTPVLDAAGHVEYLIGHAVDLTERMETQQALETLKSFYESLLDTLPLEVAALDPEGRFLYLNPAGLRDPELRRRIIGLDAPQFARLQGIDPAPYERRQAWIRSIVAAREQASLEETLTRPGQPARTILRVNRPILNDRGEVGFLVGYALDITERHTYEQGLVEARERAEELARLKSAFLANMSHEIRTPLAGIIGFAEVLEDELEGAQREAASLVRESGMRLLDTLNSVLDLARLEAEATEIQLSPRDVADEIRTAARLFAPTAGRKGLTFEVLLPGDGPPLVAQIDSAAFHRVLANLISNAIKFTETGGITLEAGRTDDQIVVCVRDTGSGMSPAFLPHVFDEFRQESVGLTRTHQGSGLGLAITKRLVDLMHGTISVESTPGAGSTFIVRLPAEAP